MSLKNAILDYLPVKDDVVDQHLAKYINNQTGNKSDFRIMFIRVKPGVYYFGNKKIFITL